MSDQVDLPPRPTPPSADAPRLYNQQHYIERGNLTYRGDLQRHGADLADLAANRQRELREAEQRGGDSFGAYWAGSASASVMRDYAAGRVSTHARRAERRASR